jgi:hypothetical protein
MVCFADLPNLPARLDFNRSKMFLLSMLKTLGVPYDGALEGAKGFAERLSDRLCSPPAKRRERITEVESAARTAYRSTTGKYEFNTPGRCSRLLPTTIGRPDAVATYCNLCPRYRPDFQPEEYYRLHLKWLLKQKITAEALRIYLELAVNGPAPDMSSLAARTRLTSHKIRNAVKQLVSRKLASETPAGRTKVYSALRPVQKSIGAKN